MFPVDERHALRQVLHELARHVLKYDRSQTHKRVSAYRLAVVFEWIDIDELTSGVDLVDKQVAQWIKQKIDLTEADEKMWQDLCETASPKSWLNLNQKLVRLVETRRGQWSVSRAGSSLQPRATG